VPLYIKVIIYTVCFLAIVGTCYYGYHYVASTNYDRGVSETEAIWRVKQVEAKEDQIHAIQTIRDSLRAQSIELQNSVVALGESKIEGEKNVERGKDILLDAIYAGTYKLYLPGKDTGYDNGVDGGGSGDETASGNAEGGCVAEGRSELHPALTAKLFGITGDADKLAEKYNYLVDYTRLLLASCGAK